jgi:ribosomal protein S18 acetylase RimI-like enzyme
MIIIRRLAVGEFDLYRQIRLASLKEAPDAFASTYESALHRSNESWREQSDNSAQGSDKAAFVVLSDDSPVGLGALYRSPVRPESGEIIQVWVSPGHRGKNVGGQLLDEILKWAKENNFQTVEANVIQGNDRALGFYQKNGFSIIGTGSVNGVIETVLTRNIS